MISRERWWSTGEEERERLTLPLPPFDWPPVALESVLPPLKETSPSSVAEPPLPPVFELTS